MTVSTAPNENQVFVGSLPSEFTAQTLIEFFSKFGRVLDAKIYVTNNDSKKVRITTIFLICSFSVVSVELRFRCL